MTWICCELERIDINPNTQDKNGICMDIPTKKCTIMYKNEIPGQNDTLLVTFAN